MIWSKIKQNKKNKSVSQKHQATVLKSTTPFTNISEEKQQR